MNKKSPIGIFDSGYGGLTVLKEIVKKLPDYDYIYLGDNARAPYGTRSSETVYEYTLENVKKLFSMGCELVLLACNTASAKALRNIQQKDLPNIDSSKRVLGVIRPTAEVINKFTKTNQIGVLGTNGTISSNSYPIEINKLHPEIKVFQQACPMLVPIVESNEIETEGTDFFVRKYLHELFSQSFKIDTLILGCTHYPLLIDKIKNNLPKEFTVLSQGEIVAESLDNYLKRHPEMDAKCSKGSTIDFYTTDSAENFDKAGSLFFGKEVKSKHITL